jgi:molybdopterin/thiamine biosynthesis adenylyltransferase
VNLTDRDLRQRDIVPPAQLAICHPLIIGVGAVGHAIALQLAAMGAQAMTLVDDDIVDVVNLATQAYAPDQLGQPKVEAAAADCRRLNPLFHYRTFHRLGVGPAESQLLRRCQDECRGGEDPGVGSAGA